MHKPQHVKYAVAVPMMVASIGAVGLSAAPPIMIGFAMVFGVVSETPTSLAGPPDLDIHCVNPMATVLQVE